MNLAELELPYHYANVAIIIGLARMSMEVDLCQLDEDADRVGALRGYTPQQIAHALLGHMYSLDVVRDTDPGTGIPLSRLTKSGRFHDPESYGVTGMVTATVTSSPEMRPRLSFNVQGTYNRPDQLGVGVSNETIVLPLESEDDLQLPPEELAKVVHVGMWCEWVQPRVDGRYDICPPLSGDAAILADPPLFKAE